MLPSYRIPLQPILKIIFSILLGKPRSFRRDAQKMVEGISHVSICGSIPDLTAFPGGSLILINHYSRPGFQIFWAGFALAAALPADIHWVITSAWTNPHPAVDRIMVSVTSWIFKRLSKMYGFFTMPPMPPQHADILARANTLRNVSTFLKTISRPILGLAPEGQDNPTGRLRMPPPGTGRWISYLVQNGLTPIPAGVYEQDGALIIRFGSPFQLTPPDQALSSQELDNRVAKEVMQQIAVCLPESLRTIDPWYSAVEEPCRVQQP